MARRGSQLDRLAALVAKLRGPKGCPWDRKQTSLSLLKYLREEAAEVEQAVKRGRWHEIEDELGDLLLNVFLQAQIAAEQGRFDIQDVARAQFLKLRRRHPHVFGRKVFKTAGEVKRHWREIKSAERLQRERDLSRRVRVE